jgi:DNA-binding CsgD family transcriptional regulator
MEACLDRYFKQTAKIILQNPSSAQTMLMLRTKGLTGGRVAKPLKFTGQQKTVMGLLCEGMSRNEIADRMGISPYSVKSHLELIYKRANCKTQGFCNWLPRVWLFTSMHIRGRIFRLIFFVLHSSL